MEPSSRPFSCKGVGPKGLRKGSAILRKGGSSVLKCHLSTESHPPLEVTTTGCLPVP